MTSRPPVVILAVTSTILAALAAYAWLALSHPPNTGKNIYDNEASFQAYVDGLGLISMPLNQARDRLMLEGFRCELFSDGSSSCHRRVQGTQCGEQQFVDLPAPGEPAWVRTRFGLVCR